MACIGRGGGALRGAGARADARVGEAWVERGAEAHRGRAVGPPPAGLLLQHASVAREPRGHGGGSAC